MLTMSSLFRTVSYLICVAVILQASEAVDQDCENTDLVTAASIENVTDSVNFTLHDHQNLSNYSIKVTYSWDVRIPEGSPLDGFLCCMWDVDDRSVRLIHDLRNVDNNEQYYSSGDFGFPIEDYYTQGEGDDDFSYCQSYVGEDFYVHHQNGTYVNCSFPCKDLNLTTCSDAHNFVCNKLEESCKILPKDQRSIEVPIRFGRKYNFEIYPYVGHLFKLPQTNNQIVKVSIFCGHHLIENEGLPRNEIYEFCLSEQNISALSTASGPVVDLSITKQVPNFRSRTVTLYLRWMSPHDTVFQSSPSRYFLATTDGQSENSIIAAKSAEEEEQDPYYTVVVENVPMGKELDIFVTPSFRFSQNCQAGLPCEKLGERKMLSVSIPTFYSCASDITYCDPLAECNNSTVALSLDAINCTCRPGYIGNGQNADTIEKGTGCKNFNACSVVELVTSVCSSVAVCVDAHPPSMEIADCICPSGYFGDGLTSGSGCTQTRVIIGVVAGIAAVVVLVIASACLIRKRHAIKKNVLNARTSVYVAKASGTYTKPVTHSDNNGFSPSTQPVFGNNWEIDRSALKLLEVAGRGNFGVVHKAILAKNEAERVVAVKSLTGSYSTTNREEFLSEMSLLRTLIPHENIVNVIGVCTTLSYDNVNSLSPLLVTEYMIYGDLLHFLWKARETSNKKLDRIYDFTELSLYKVGRQVAQGLQHLSKQRVLHGDVAARNILVGQNLHVKITDFGLANDVYRYGMIKGATERRVPYKWISPERMEGGRSPITWQSDIWSFGILLYEMVTLGATPYVGIPAASLFQKLQSGYRIPQPTSCSDYLYAIMKDCWSWTAYKRPRFKELIQRLNTPEAKDVSNPPALVTSINVISEVDPSAYEKDIGKRDSSTLLHEAPQSHLNNGNGKVTTNGSINLTNGHARTPVNLTNGKLSNDNTGRSLWAGDILVDRDMDENPHIVNGSNPNPIQDIV